MQGKDNQKAPDISIDEALNLFLAVAYPRGIPEEVDREQLMNALRQKIAADRPDWAKAGQGAQQTSAIPVPPGRSDYANLKQDIAQKAQQEDIPQDPEERYLYNRRKEAAQNRENKKEEERENQTREDLRKRLIAQKKTADEETLEKALLIRQALEKRLSALMPAPTPTTAEAKPDAKLTILPPHINIAGFTPLQNETAQSEPPMQLSPTQPPGNGFTLDNPASVPPGRQLKTAKEDAREFFNHIKDLKPEEQIRGLQEFNRSRRGLLKTRTELLESRRPEPGSKRSSGFSLEIEKQDKETKRGAVGLEFSPASGRRSLSMTVSLENGTEHAHPKTMKTLSPGHQGGRNFLITNPLVFLCAFVPWWPFF